MSSITQQQDRDGSHGMAREPLLEPFLARYRYRFTLAFIEKTCRARNLSVRGFDIGCGFRGVFVEQVNKLPGVSFHGGGTVGSKGSATSNKF